MKPSPFIAQAIAHFLTRMGWDDESITILSVSDDDQPYFVHLYNPARELNIYLHTIISNENGVWFYDARVVPEWSFPHAHPERKEVA